MQTARPKYLFDKSSCSAKSCLPHTVSRNDGRSQRSGHVLVNLFEMTCVCRTQAVSLQTVVVGTDSIPFFRIIILWRLPSRALRVTDPEIDQWTDWCCGAQTTQPHASEWLCLAVVRIVKSSICQTASSRKF